MQLARINFHHRLLPFQIIGEEDGEDRKREKGEKNEMLHKSLYAAPDNDDNMRKAVLLAFLWLTFSKKSVVNMYGSVCTRLLLVYSGILVNDDVHR